MSAMFFAQQVLNGLLAGVYYLLIALGLSLIFSLGGIVNLAHGAFYAIGAYLTVVLSPMIGFGGVVRRRADTGRHARGDDRAHAIPPLLSVRSDPVAADDLRPRHGRGAGAADDLRRAALVLFDPAWLRGQVVHRQLHLFVLSRGAARHRRDLHRAASGSCCRRTSFGRVVRAGVQNPDMVGALGISLQPYMSAVAALGIGLAGLAGVMLAPIYSIHPAMGQEIITPAFVVVVIGGLGSFWGVVAAAMMVGFVKGVMVGIGYSAVSTAAIYLLMLLVLLFRPRGLFGERIHTVRVRRPRC